MSSFYICYRLLCALFVFFILWIVISVNWRISLPINNCIFVFTLHTTNSMISIDIFQPLKLQSSGNYVLTSASGVFISRGCLKICADVNLKRITTWQEFVTVFSALNSNPIFFSAKLLFRHFSISKHSF